MFDALLPIYLFIHLMILLFELKSLDYSSNINVITVFIQGYSTSELWYAVLDYGTNYCNLHNLITGNNTRIDLLFVSIRVIADRVKSKSYFQ